MMQHHQGDITCPNVQNLIRVIVDRELFEKAARKEWPEIDMTRQGEGYRSTHCQRWWEGWKLKACV